MIFVGLDDTDVAGSPGTNQLARAIVGELGGDWRCERIVRHQLLEDPRVPCTSKNGSASIALQAGGQASTAALIDVSRRVMRGWFVEGSDPGLCVATLVPRRVVDFGRRCQNELVSQQDALDLAQEARLHLEGLGGTNGGVIGALAAVGLAATGDDGRIVQVGSRPDDLSGVQPVPLLRRRGVAIRDPIAREEILEGTVDVGKKLRPNLRGGAAVLFVRPHPVPDGTADYRALKLP